MPTGGWSGLFNRVGGAQHDLLIPRGHTHARRISAIVRAGIGGILSTERVFTNLNEDVKQVTPNAQPGNPIVNGGMIPIAVNPLTSVSSANFISYVEKPNKPIVAGAPDGYPRDASGNGGGGKLGLKL
jgi:hypothetical protein